MSHVPTKFTGRKLFTAIFLCCPRETCKTIRHEITQQVRATLWQSWNPIWTCYICRLTNDKAQSCSAPGQSSNIDRHFFATLIQSTCAYNLDLRRNQIIKWARCLPRRRHPFVCLVLHGLWQCTNAYASRIHCLPGKLPPFQLLPNWRIISPAPCVMTSLPKQWLPLAYTAFVRTASLIGGPKRVSPKGALSAIKNVPQSATFAQIWLLTPLSSCSSQMGNVRMITWKWYFAAFTYATASNY